MAPSTSGRRLGRQLGAANRGHSALATSGVLSTQRSVPAGRRRCQAAAARRAAMRGRRTPPAAGRAVPASLRGGSQQPAVPRCSRPRCSRPCNRVAAGSAHKHAPRGLLAAWPECCGARFPRLSRLRRAGLRCALHPQTCGGRGAAARSAAGPASSLSQLHVCRCVTKCLPGMQVSS